MRIHFVVPGPPVAKARARICKSGHFYTPKKTADYESSVKGMCRNAMAGLMILKGPVRIITNVFVKIPRTWAKKKKEQAVTGEIRPTSRPDFDNYLKAICDACNGVAYLDDSQVVEWSGKLLYGCDPRVDVWIEGIQ